MGSCLGISFRDSEFRKVEIFKHKSAVWSVGTKYLLHAMLVSRLVN
jgi:hypothetical protein